jgi:hypothetical protein
VSTLIGPRRESSKRIPTDVAHVYFSCPSPRTVREILLLRLAPALGDVGALTPAFPRGDRLCRPDAPADSPSCCRYCEDGAAAPPSCSCNVSSSITCASARAPTPVSVLAMSTIIFKMQLSCTPTTSR